MFTKQCPTLVPNLTYTGQGRDFRIHSGGYSPEYCRCFSTDTIASLETDRCLSLTGNSFYSSATTTKCRGILILIRADPEIETSHGIRGDGYIGNLRPCPVGQWRAGDAKPLHVSQGQEQKKSIFGTVLASVAQEDLQRFDVF